MLSKSLDLYGRVLFAPTCNYNSITNAVKSNRKLIKFNKIPVDLCVIAADIYITTINKRN